MDKIAVISDIHGNMTALEAVLADIWAQDVETIYCLGDLIGKGPSGAAAIDRCREVCDAVVLGNWDDFICTGELNEVSQWHYDRLGRSRVEYLVNLPHTIDLVMSGRHVRLYHASQTSVHHRVHPFMPFEKLLAMFDNTDFTGHEHPQPDVVGYGDIHAAYMLPIYDHQKTLFNTGSVGNPLDEPTASYVILTGTRGETKKTRFSLDIVRVAYDIDAAIEEARASEMPLLEPYENELRTAIYRGRKKAE